MTNRFLHTIKDCQCLTDVLNEHQNEPLNQLKNISMKGIKNKKIFEAKFMKIKLNHSVILIEKIVELPHRDDCHFKVSVDNQLKIESVYWKERESDLNYNDKLSDYIEKAHNWKNERLSMLISAANDLTFNHINRLEYAGYYYYKKSIENLTVKPVIKIKNNLVKGKVVSGPSYPTIATFCLLLIESGVYKDHEYGKNIDTYGAFINKSKFIQDVCSHFELPYSERIHKSDWSQKLRKEYYDKIREQILPIIDNETSNALLGYMNGKFY